MLCKVATVLKTASALCLSCALFAVLLFFNTLPTGQGESEYYLYSPSSQAKIKETLSFSDLPFVEGRSECYRFDNVEETELFVKELEEKTHAVPLLSETVDGVKSVYYKADLPYFVRLNGQKINLHIAVKENLVKVGTPIIFGGF